MLRSPLLGVSLWLAFGWVSFASADASTEAAAEPAASILSHGDFEVDADGDQWPDDWSTLKVGGAWVEEEGNHFLRLTSAVPGKMVMMYREVQIPAGVEALELTWRQRITDLVPGKASWFDARIMLEFMDASRAKASPTPKPSYTRRNTEGWVDKRIAFLVPTNAATLKFMPCLFQVQAGTYDLDAIQLRPVEAGPIRAEAEAAAAERARVAEERAGARRAQAAKRLAELGTLIPNGSFEQDTKGRGEPDGWGSLKGIGAWVVEGTNRHLRIEASPGKMVNLYKTYDLPEGIEALELTWRHRVTGLKIGEKPWFDARILMDFLDAQGGKLPKSPAAPYAQKDTAGWVEKSKSFLVPTGAVAIAIMPTLFQARAGTYELDDLALKPTDPAPIHAAAAERAALEKARYVPPEEPDTNRWPKTVKVVGNRLHDPDGNEVWLQGVNAGGLETLPHDEQAIKSLVVAIDEWKANCVRIPMNDVFWYGRSPYQQDGGEAYRAKLDKMVTLAANRGAYVVIDLHRFRAPKQEHADFWKDCAARYRNHPAVLFDLFNEPHGISWDVWKDGGFVGEEGKVDESAFLTAEEKAKNRGFESVGMQALVDAVRSTGAKNIVIAGGLFWCNDLSGITKGYALRDDTGHGIMYSWHTYNWHTDWEERVLGTAALHHIFLGEVGADTNKMDFIPAEHQEDPYTWVPDMLGFIQQHKIHWTGWCFHPRATPVMISDWHYTPTPFWGEFAKQALSGKRFEMKRMR